eukprot:g1436.t1
MTSAVFKGGRCVLSSASETSRPSADLEVSNPLEFLLFCGLPCRSNGKRPGCRQSIHVINAKKCWAHNTKPAMLAGARSSTKPQLARNRVVARSCSAGLGGPAASCMH